MNEFNVHTNDKLTKLTEATYIEEPLTFSGILFLK